MVAPVVAGGEAAAAVAASSDWSFTFGDATPDLEV
jgi:hypothetical protein